MLDAEAGLEGRRLGEVAQRRAEGGDVDGLAGGRGGRGEGGRVDDLLRLARAVEAVGLGGDGFGHDAGEEAGVEMEDGLRVLVDGPGEAGARGEVGKAGGRGLKRVAEPAGEREPRAELEGVFSVESQLPLREGDERGAGGEREAGGRAARQVEERAAVLLEAGDGGGDGGGVVVRVERGRVASTEGERAVEGVGIGFVNEDAERLRADFPGLLVVRVEEVFVDFEIALAVVEILRGAAATEEETGDVEAGSGRERRLRRVFPGEGGVGFVEEIDADGLRVGEAEVVLADGGVVAGAGEDEAADALVAEVVGVGGEGRGDDVGWGGLPVGAGGGDPETLRGGDGLVEGGWVRVRVECDGVDDVEFADVAFFEREEEVAAGFGDGAAELEAVTAAAGGRRDGGEGIVGVERAFAVGEKERAVNFGSTGFGVNLDAATGVGRVVVLGGKKIRRGYNSRDRGFGRKGAGVLEAVDGDAGGSGCATVGGGEDLELAVEIVGIVGKLGNVFLREGVGSDAVVGVETGAVVGVADVDAGVHGGEGEMEVEVESLAGARVDEEAVSRRSRARLP